MRVIVFNTLSKTDIFSLVDKTKGTSKYVKIQWTNLMRPTRGSLATDLFSQKYGGKINRIKMEMCQLQSQRHQHNFKQLMRMKIICDKKFKSVTRWLTLATKLGKEEDIWYKISTYDTWLPMIAPGLPGASHWCLDSA